VCDEQCELKERNKKLAEAFGIVPTGSKAPQYSELLLNLVRVSPQLVKRFEQVFDEFLKTPPSNTKLSLPPMDRVKRQLVHELAKYYHLETQSLDKEPLRSVIVARTRESKLPNMLLSEFMALRQPLASSTQSGSSSVGSRGPVSALHIHNLQSYVKTPHLVAFLQPFAGHYKLQWIDDSNCLALFDSELTMRTALSELSGGLFSVKVYKDHLEASPTEFHLTPLSSTSTAPREKTSRAPPIRVSKEDESWRNDDNSFKVLNEAGTTTTSTPASWDDEEEVGGITTTTPTTTTTTAATKENKEKEIEEDFKVIKSGEELDDWTLLDDSNATHK